MAKFLKPGFAIYAGLKNLPVDAHGLITILKRVKARRPKVSV